jgi:hypothetical protein
MHLAFTKRSFSLLPWYKYNMTNNRYASFFEKLETLYANMNSSYGNAAAYYRFDCKGCLENCCLTRFYHHTHLECLYLLEGLSFLAEEKQSEVTKKAKNYNKKAIEYDVKKKLVRQMCPLNFDDLCILYNYRPMICRLHGVSHELKKPGRDIVYSPGCDEFTKLSEGKTYFRFDRTPFYIKMAQLEKGLKLRFGFTKKFKRTIAQMLMDKP